MCKLVSKREELLVLALVNPGLRTVVWGVTIETNMDESIATPHRWYTYLCAWPVIKVASQKACYGSLKCNASNMYK
jgi:hypothetical protein